MTSRVLFLGGNGHSASRLDPARTELERRGAPLRLVEAPYPGFEGRPRARDLGAFLDTVCGAVRSSEPDLVYATGIGGLLALALRARGELTGVPLILQGAVLWGLEQRTFARVMRGPLPHLLQLALRTPPARRRFRAHHLAGVAPEHHDGFFRGYEQCTAFPDFFRWLRAPLLRSLERSFRERPELLDGISFWWGAHDGVVGLDELRVTERALEVRFPLRRFESWGHYPMLQDPAGWAEELERAVA